MSTGEERQVLALLNAPADEDGNLPRVLPLFERARASLDAEGVDPDASEVQGPTFVVLAEAAAERGEFEVAEACVQTFAALAPPHDQVSRADAHSR